ncbi:hypothetical protein OPV22_004610 [Ensete ventricosum]|uniref:Uncharacterized protein n=1 Tax=Ensete ventricosum TaxID=4639 RepID=A0AAV8RJ75_ENSVE|nr:hypothetical protein OPV22_004610 [Ensete ventricosum]
MKAVGAIGEFKPLLLRISAVAAACLAAFFFGKHWSSASYPQLPFYPRSPAVSSFDGAAPLSGHPFPASAPTPASSSPSSATPRKNWGRRRRREHAGRFRSGRAGLRSGGCLRRGEWD